MYGQKSWGTHPRKSRADFKAASQRLGEMFPLPLFGNLGFGKTVAREGDGNPLQYSCLENPMDRGAWWAAVHGVAESRT